VPRHWGNLSEEIVYGDLAMNQQLVWHSLQPDEVVAKLKSDLTCGLSRNDASERLQQFGPNELPESKKRTLLSIFLHQFRSPLIYLLVVAAGIAFFIGEARDSIVILVVVSIGVKALGYTPSRY
jgi:magnesium-transporting ATPase (P-type)